MASYWQDLIPTEIITHIFQYLPRRDRMSCSLVCQKWKEALNRPDLWKKIILHIDKDFLEPSTILLTSEYCRHLKTLEIGWEKPQMQNRWLPLKIHDLTKRVVRYVLILNENNVQIKNFKIFEWHDIFPIKKIIYHLARFLKMQTKLEKIIFYNNNLPKSECLKILEACLESKFTVNHLEIHNYFYPFNTAFDTDEFLLCLKEFSHLKELKLDYFVLSRPLVIDIIIENGITSLHNMEIFFDENDVQSAIIPDLKWRKLKKNHPELKVFLAIKNVCHFEQLQFLFLMEEIPLQSFSLCSSNKFNQNVSRNFEETISSLLKNFSKTLEYVNLEIKNNKENIDNLLFQIVKYCPNLKRLFFDGNISADMNLFSEICQYKGTAKGLNVSIVPNNLKYITNLVHMFS